MTICPLSGSYGGCAASCLARPLGEQISLNYIDVVTTWRNREGCGLGTKFVRRIAAAFGYAGLVVAGMVEAMVKSILAVAFLMVAPLPCLRQKALHLGVASVGGALGGLLACYLCLPCIVASPFARRLDLYWTHPI